MADAGTAGPGSLGRGLRVSLSGTASYGDLSGRATSEPCRRFVPLCVVYPCFALLWGSMCDCNVTNSQRISNSMIASPVRTASIGRWEGVHNTEPPEGRPPRWM